MGDLNDIGRCEEQWGNERVNRFSIDMFVTAYKSCNMLDMGTAGPKFTWCRQVGGQIIAHRRLDQVLWNIQAQMDFPKAISIMLPSVHSDHNPIVFVSIAGVEPLRENKPFRFEDVWMTRDTYEKKFGVPLGMKLIWIFFQGVAEITRKSKVWNKEIFGNIFRKKRLLQARINGLQQSINYNHSRGVQELEKRLIGDLDRVLDQEELLWFQKSWACWIWDGDRNTSFYHRSTVVQRGKSRVRMLKMDEVWVHDPAQLKDHIISLFTCLFDGNMQTSSTTHEDLVGLRMNDNRHGFRLTRKTMLDEVRKAVRGMKRFGSPGPDMIPTAFYQRYWDVVGPR